MTGKPPDPLLQDDLIQRLRPLDRRTPELPPCAERSLADRCYRHIGDSCVHLDRYFKLETRKIGDCPVCQPGAWRTIHSASVGPSTEVSESDGRVSWDEYFFAIARQVASRATCPRASIGVVLVDSCHRIVATGYNGAGPGQEHCSAVGCTLYADHCVRARHAEANAIEAAYEIATTISGSWIEYDQPFLVGLDITPYIFGPRPVCSHCAGLLHTAGITKEPKCLTS